MYIGIAGMYVCVRVDRSMYVQCSWRPEEGVGSLETWATEGCEASREHWEQNLGPLEEQTVLLIAEPWILPSSVSEDHYETFILVC